jgi:hypothetical protein
MPLKERIQVNVRYPWIEETIEAFDEAVDFKLS